ncbi:hypothetical protein Patl1_14172 [Pistacia atlantica]|uniref:Uncharacterized protein n=1 Tax=Pistacia atlantica TaxID=434234 RepID=A0ACC1AS56_9ROSI|nr:hypothetical protein Patl1_14172 [Pistacia atlantica]
MQLMPNDYIFASALSACASLQAAALGREIHAQAVKLGYASICFVFNSIMSMYMKCGHCCDALLVFDEALEPNSVSYNALITGFVENKEYEKGLEMFKLMHEKGLVPDWFTFAGVLESCVNMNDLRWGMVVHCQTLKLKLDSTAFVGNVIMTMYSKFDLMKEAENVFRLIEEKDVISWNSFIAGCSHCMDHEKGLRVFKEMSNEYIVRPDEFTFTSALAAYVIIGKRLAEQLLKLQPVTTSPYVLLSHMYASDAMWSDVAEVRKMLKGSGLKKEPAHSMIEVKGNFEKFTVGKFSHARIGEIKCMLNIIGWAAAEVSLKDILS